MTTTTGLTPPPLIHVLDAITTLCIGVSVLAVIGAFHRKLRSICGAVIFGCTWFWGLHIWIWCIWVILKQFAHPHLWIVLGVLLGIVGIIPLTAFGLAVAGRWAELGNIAFFAALIIGGRLVAERMLES